MLTGVIEEAGTLLSVKGGLPGSRLVIEADRILGNIKRRDSIAVNGVCLTVASFDPGFFLADVIPEILKRSDLGYLSIKSSLNLERAIIAGGRLGGHIVLGHIDGTGTIVNVVRNGNALRCTIRSAPSILRRIIEKGSIAIDGVGLTVTQVRGQNSSVPLIPHTASHTTLGALKPDCVVNLENDCMRKYIERPMRISPSAHSTEGEDTRNRGTGSQTASELPK